MRIMIKNINLNHQGHDLLDFYLDDNFKELVINKNWAKLDKCVFELTAAGSPLHQLLRLQLDFTSIEHLIAIRSAPDDEDGIWHDDGSRILGFSLSLNLEPDNIIGGQLLFKSKENNLDPVIYPPQPWGKLIIFLSGLSGYEHKVTAVSVGQRIVIAGWCS